MATAATNPSSESQRWRSLDVLRGIAILLVLFHHIALKNPTSADPLWMHGVEVLQRGGWIGVDLFFVLSGFLVSGILFRQYQKTGQIRTGEFLIRRGFKIYPQFWLLIAVSVWLGVSRDSVKVITPQHVWAELLFVQNYWEGIWSHTWSLAVEEHCYLVLVFLLAAWGYATRGNTVPFRGLLWILAAGIVLALGIRFRMVQANPIVKFPTHQMPTHARFDNFLIGVCLSYWYTFYPRSFLETCRQWKFGCFMAGTALLAWNFWYVFDFRASPAGNIRNHFIATVGLTLNWLGASLLLMAACGFNWASRRGNLLTWIGQHSYGIYLWHTLLFNKLLVPFTRDYFASSHTRLALYVAFYIVGTVCAGALSSWLIERPALRIRDWLCPSSSGGLKARTINDLTAVTTQAPSMTPVTADPLAASTQPC